MKTYLRPVGFVDSPVGFDGLTARLAGGLIWFSAVEVIAADSPKRLVPVAGIAAELDRLGEEAQLQWHRLTAPRPPLQVGGRTIRVDQPQVMGIVNAAPDSFSDGGAYPDAEAAIAAGHAMTAAGAAIIDVGGESTRPGAQPVFEGDEEQRVVPVVRALAAAGTAVSIDTRKAGIASLALQGGAGLVNDVSALTFDPRMAQIVARSGCPLVLMHHQGAPETMQQAPHYDGPVTLAVHDWLEERIAAAEAAGIERGGIIVDPGIGFGKSVQHNLELLNNLALLHGLGCAVMVGASRKRTIGALSNEAPADQRLGGSLTLALKAVEQGAQMVRVHDVFETVQALRVWRGLRDAALSAV
ncbi:MAG TPA: dihydropteroate synthase [Allosphingosinicella sp.]